MRGFADDLVRMLPDLFPAVGHFPVVHEFLGLLAWFVWITFASPATTTVGLAFVGIGFYLRIKSDDSATGTVSWLGFQLSGTPGTMLIGGGILIYLLGGGLMAPPLPVSQ